MRKKEQTSVEWKKEKREKVHFCKKKKNHILSLVYVSTEEKRNGNKVEY